MTRNVTARRVARHAVRGARAVAFLRGPQLPAARVARTTRVVFPKYLYLAVTSSDKPNSRLEA